MRKLALLRLEPQKKIFNIIPVNFYRLDQLSKVIYLIALNDLKYMER